MLNSMTGFVRQQVDQEWGQAVWEIRSVNHRYLDLSCRLPESWRELETTCRAMTKQYLRRGRIEIQLSISLNSAAAAGRLNQEYAKRLRTFHHALDELDIPLQAFEPTQLLRVPELVVSNSPDRSPILTALTTSFAKALEELCNIRSQEGKALQQFLENTLAELRGLLEDIAADLPAQQEAQRARLVKLFDDHGISYDTSRLEQELLLQLQKSDVTEELTRLTAHCDEVAKLLTATGTQGRRLDFFMQELHREVNTLGAKSVNATLSQRVVTLKVLIEQMREQVQNIE